MKKQLFLPLLLLGVTLQCFSQSAICSYAFRKRITIDPSRVAGPVDLTNFPVLISIASDNDLRTTANSGQVQNANGFDIVFTAADGVTLLNFQRETYTATNGAYTAWVLVPNLSTSISTVLYMYYGNTAVVTDQSNSSVFTNYHAVWHFENNSFLDNSPSGYTLTNNATTNQSPAFISGGRANSGTQWLEVANTFPNLNSNFTMSGWAYTTNNGRTGQRIFCDDVSNSGGYALSIGDNGTGSVRFFSRGSSPVFIDAPNNTIANNTWYYVVAVADITNLTRRIFVNGVQVASGAFTGWGVDNGNASVAGETAGGETGNRLQGRIDEVRVAKSALSADWILTEYNNQSSPATFYTISAAPKVWLGNNNSNTNLAANWLNSSVPASDEDVIITNSANQPNLQSDIQVNALFIRPGAILSLTNRTLSVRSDITNCGTINGGTGYLRCNSTASFVQNQYFSGSGTYNLNNLTVNNTFTAGALILNKDVSVSGALDLVQGIVYTNTTNILALGTTASSSAGSASSFVSGPMSKAGTTNFVFPLGKGTRWRRASVSNISSASTFRAEYFNSQPTNTASVNAPLNNISSVEFWQVDRVAGTGNANLGLYWESANQSGIDNCGDLTIARYNGTSWDVRSAATLGGSSCTGAGTGTIVTSSALSAFSPFTFGSASSGVNPLPIQLTDFHAHCDEKQNVRVTWKTASETNNAYFTLERSNDGENWQELVKKTGAGTTNAVKTYTHLDAPSDEGIQYYRLSQTDTDGRTETFGVVPANCASKKDEIILFPNPATHVLSLRSHLSQNYTDISIQIIDNLGRPCLEKRLPFGKGIFSFDLQIDLVPGTYTVLFISQQINFPPKKLLIR